MNPLRQHDFDREFESNRRWINKAHKLLFTVVIIGLCVSLAFWLVLIFKAPAILDRILAIFEAKQ